MRSKLLMLFAAVGFVFAAEANTKHFAFKNGYPANVAREQTASAGVRPTASGDRELPFGMPKKSDQIIRHTGFAIGYNWEWKQPDWVAYELTDDKVLNVKVGRCDNFQPDPAVRPANSAQLADYKGSGYDRGHMAPSGDMKWSSAAQTECFYLSNMSPQNGSLNSGVWNEIENTVRGFACSEKRIYIVTGPIFTSLRPRTIGASKVAVPDGYYKIVYAPDAGKMIAFRVANQKISGKPIAFTCNVDSIERDTHMDFFPDLPRNIQDELEARYDPKLWNWSKSQKRQEAGTAAPVSSVTPVSATRVRVQKEYFAGTQMPVGSRKPCPVTAEFPDTGYWLSTNSDKRHGRSCENYRRTRGYPCGPNDGSPCGKCKGR